jgi:hypothetical protein
MGGLIQAPGSPPLVDRGAQNVIYAGPALPLPALSWSQYSMILVHRNIDYCDAQI